MVVIYVHVCGICMYKCVVCVSVCTYICVVCGVCIYVVAVVVGCVCVVKKARGSSTFVFWGSVRTALTG